MSSRYDVVVTSAGLQQITEEGGKEEDVKFHLAWSCAPQTWVSGCGIYWNIKGNTKTVLICPYL